MTARRKQASAAVRVLTYAFLAVLVPSIFLTVRASRLVADSPSLITSREKEGARPRPETSGVPEWPILRTDIGLFKWGVILLTFADQPGDSCKVWGSCGLGCFDSSPKREMRQLIA